MTVVIDKIAWICLRDGRILSARSKGKDTYYVPGGKRDPGESDADTLVREVQEEVSVRLKPETIRHYGTFEAQAHGRADGELVRMACYYADYEGELKPSSEIDELAWLTYREVDRVSPVARLLWDRLRQENLLR
ncbi:MULTISPECIES: NUDIX hydrolase [Paenibacillus]|uniref:NUDIX hydrolase n=1 Tax=Paenibacillus TaxID=44249 RepID=UPI0022B8E2C2|nr:NUDIX domain-containing protein [Paenibacillus caseinilyticus]MCZ8520318.1 NUDIX domain-containing protein [Paenibacillus caseinilyticus]